MTTAPAPATRMHVLSHGRRLAADHWGTEDESPILFLHGGGQTRHSWGGSAAALTREGRYAITVDMRGHGDSDWDPDRRYDVAAYADDMAEFVTDLPGPPILVGASLGGMTGMLLEGETAPGSLQALVLVDIVPRMNSAGAERILAFMRQHVEDGFGSLEEVADAIAEYNPHRPRPKDVDGLKKNLRLRNGRWFWHWDPGFLEGPLTGEDVEQRDARNAEMLTAALHRAEVPITLIRGRVSDLVTEAELTQFQTEFPEATFTDVSGAGHMVAGDRNDLFTAAVMAFIDGVNS